MSINRKIVGSTVTTEDLNALNYLASEYIELSEEIVLSKSSVSGEYGSYYLDSSVNDDLTGDCKLHYTTGFSGVTYILELVYFKTTGESVVTETLGVDGLFTVTTPSGFDYFDTVAKIRVRNGKHTLGRPILNLTASSSTIYVGGTSTITATLTDDGVPVEGADIVVSVGGSLSTITTNSSGVATYTFTGVSSGSFPILMSYGSVTSSILISVLGLTTTLTLTGADCRYGDVVSLSGTLKQSSTALSGKSVKIYKSNSLLDTVITDSDGAFSYSDSDTSTLGTFTYKAVFEGDSTYEASEVTKDIVISKANTSLAIDVPLVLVYGDEFDITGTLKDHNDNLLEGMTVDLYVGSSKVDTGTTDSDGEVEFTRTPVSMGTHSFQLKFDGDNTYANSDSSTVTRDITKETSVLTLNSPLNNSAYYDDESISVSGVLTDNDGETLANKDIVISESGTTITTLTTDSDGEFTGSLSGLSVGSHSLVFEFEADTYYTGSSVTRTVTVQNHVYVLTASASSSTIIVGNSVTISGTFTKDGSPFASKTINFKINGTYITASALTDSNGNYSKTITGLSVGTHTINASYGPLDSDSVTVTVTDHTYSLSCGLSSSTITEGDNVTVTGNLTKDSSAWESQTITIQANGSSLGTATTDSNGDYSYVVSGLNAGSYTVKAVHSDAESSGVSLTVESALEPDTITLSGTASIIQSGGTSTVTATLKDGSSVCSGFVLDYEIKKGSTVISSGSDTTDSNGEISLTYTGTGVGDVDVIVSYGILLQETYAIEDCKFYDSMTSNSGHWSPNNGATLGISQYSANGWKLGNASAYTRVLCDYTVSYPSEISFEVTDKGNSYDNGLFIGENGSSYALLNLMNGNNKVQLRVTNDYNTYNTSVIGKWTLKIYSNKFEVYYGNTKLGERSYSNLNPLFGIECGTQSTRYIQIKDIKIKAL